MTTPELSVIITCYLEEHTIEEFYGRLRAVLERCGRSFEIILVNDGSTDRTLERLRAIHAASSSVRVLDLYRNSGQTAAMTAGIEQARGRDFLFLDSDLQLDPEELPRLLEAFDDGADVVSGRRISRQDSLLRRVPSALVNRWLARLTRTPFHDIGCTYKLYRGDLLRAFQVGPSRIFNPLLVLRSASRFREVPVTHHRRRQGRSGWSVRRLLDFTLENALGTSRGLFQYLSLFSFLIAFLTLLRIVLAWVVPGSILASPPTPGLLLNAMLLATACLLGVLCLLGEYLVRLHEQARAGPQYVVREMLEPRPGPEQSAAGGPP